ncbi:MAG: class I SAM-dependent methyltransferase [Bacilli bacterium]|nr:class I SAM-dependent methyltransferase [Bacilli bacterium]
MEHYFTNNENLQSEIRTLAYHYKDEEFLFLSDNGIFSKDKLDFGSRLLIETFLENEKRTNLDLLDVGCGYGFIGITVSKILDSFVTMCDINKRALHLANRNIEKNKIRGETILSNIYENITKKYDVILTNPPIRAGKVVVSKILMDAKNHLKPKGTLWFVIRKDQGAKSMLALVSKIAKCEIIEKSKGFYIMRAEFS